MHHTNHSSIAFSQAVNMWLIVQPYQAPPCQVFELCVRRYGRTQKAHIKLGMGHDEPPEHLSDLQMCYRVEFGHFVCVGSEKILCWDSPIGLRAWSAQIAVAFGDLRLQMRLRPSAQERKCQADGASLNLSCEDELRENVFGSQGLPPGFKGVVDPVRPWPFQGYIVIQNQGTVMK